MLLQKHFKPKGKSLQILLVRIRVRLAEENKFNIYFGLDFPYYTFIA